MLILLQKWEESKSQVFTMFATAKQQEESEADKLTKGITLMITGEKVESILSEVCCIVDQLQSEVQQDIKAVLHSKQAMVI